MTSARYAEYTAYFLIQWSALIGALAKSLYVDGYMINAFTNKKSENHNGMENKYHSYKP